MLRKFALMVAAGSAMFFSAAYALGLGEIDVDSHLNQKFSASIPLNSISPEEAENLLVRLADSDDFNKAGIERSDYLSTLNFKVVTDAKNSRIVISSKQLAREPFLSFLLDVRSSTGRVLREYTVLLDPPAYTQPAAPVVAATPAAKAPTDYYQTSEEANQSKAATTPAPAPVPAAPAPAAKPATPVKPAPAASVPAPVAEVPVADMASDTAPSTYGPVKAQETFWSIASKLRPNPSVTMDQMLWSLYSANPQAFEGKRITGLLKGSTLKVPSLSAITEVSPAAAKEHLQALQGHRAASPKKVTPAAALEEPAPAAAAPIPKPEPAPKAASKPAAPEKKTPEAVTPPPPAAAPAKPVVEAPAAKTPVPAPAPAQSTPEPAAAPATAPTPEGATPDQASSTTPAATPAEPAAEAPAPVPPPKPAKRPVQPASSAFADDWMAPAIAGALVLILALLGIRFWQKRQAEKDDSAAPVLTSKASSNLQFWKRAAESAPSATIPSKFAVPPPPPAPVPAKPAAKSILDVPPPPPKPSNPLWDDTVAQAAAEPGFDLTQTMDRHGDTASKFEETSVDEFNATNQFDADGGKASHEANDPVSEADFHLAYGLYDEAALLLESAVEKNPGRSDIRVKLAETYFRANKPHEFDDVAQSLKPQLDEIEWQKIAIMGSQLLPDSPLYKGAAGAALEDSVDLAFDEPIDLGAAETQIFSTTAATPAAPQPSARSSSSSSVLDFKLEDLEAPQVSKSPPPPPAKGAESNTLEFNLSDFDLTPASAKPAAAPAPAAVAEAPAAALAPASNAVEFDLGGFDLEPAKSAGDAGALGDDINLDDFDLGELADDSHAISAGDEAGTKLDLARAYVDMGDNDMARSLLTEVLVQGSEEQKTEAQALIQRLA